MATWIQVKLTASEIHELIKFYERDITQSEAVGADTLFAKHRIEELRQRLTEGFGEE